jgi:hypothetical protein
MKTLLGRALSIFMLCVCPGAASLLAQATASPECLQAMEAIRSRCCGNAFTPPSSRPVRASTGTARLYDCATGNFTEIECVPRAGAVSREIWGRPIEREGADEKAGSASCKRALQGLAACGPLGKGDERPLCEDSQKGSSLALPICEDVEDLSRELEESDCSPLNGTECSTPGSTCLVDGLDQSLGGLDGQPLSSNPEDVKLLKAPPEQPGTGTPAPLSPKQLPVPDWNAPLPVLRLQIPGNFLRFFLANAALPSALKGFEQKTKAANLGGIACDPAALTCTIEPLSVVPNLDQVIQKALKSNFKMDVARNGQGWRLSNLRFTTEAVKVIFHGNVDLNPKEPIRIDLKHGTHLEIVPLHDPKATNGYATTLVPIDRQASFLDRALIVTGLKGGECTALAGKNAGYITYIQPYRCSCGAPDATSGSVLNFCVADPWPRVMMIPELAPDAMKAKGWFAREAFCNERPLAANASGFQVNNTDVGAGAGPLPPATQLSAETPLITFYKALGMTDAALTDLANTFEEVGCSGRRMKRLAFGPELPINTGNFSFAWGQRLTSAAGFKLGTRVDLGALEVKVGATEAWIEVQLPIFGKAEEWVRKKFGAFSFIVKWIIRLIRHILEATLTLLATVTLKEGPNHATFDFGHLDFEVHGLLSHATGEDGGSQLEIGVRRVVSSAPSLNPPELGLEWDAPACKDLLAANGDGIGARLKKLLACSVELPSATIEQATYPLKHFLAEDVFGLLGLLEGKIADKLNSITLEQATKLESKNDLAGLIASASRTVLLRPYYLVNDASAARAAMATAPGEDLDQEATEILRRLPPPFNQVCLASSQPAFSCLVTNLFAGHRLRVPGATLLRVGAMTHYRSFWEGDQKSVFTDWNYPTVRYCVGGDTPPGLKAYSFYGSAPLLQRLTDFDEMDRTASPADPATDWRTQCAAFLDLGVKVHTTTPRSAVGPARDVVVVPSVRTNFLLNEVFFCPDNASCDPATPTTEKRRSLRYRAMLASCSMLADFWYASCPEDANGLHCDQVQTYANAAIDANSTRQVLLGMLTQSCGTDASCQAQVNAAANAADPMNTCLGMLAEQGFSIPPTLKASDVPAGLK